MTRVVATSVRGPAHIRDGVSCQDAWLAKLGTGASLAVVCDGMGSRPHAREGARAATLAARDAWQVWRRSTAGSVEDLVRLLEVCWRLRIHAIPPEQAAATCLLYAEDGHGRAILAQLGDGILAHRNKVGDVAVHPARTRGFGITHALGTTHTLADWSLSLIPPLQPSESVMLATDGVSEDLERERLGDLMSWVVEDLGTQRNANLLLRSELRNWPVPHHQDDKTLLVMWEPCSPSRE